MADSATSPGGPRVSAAKKRRLAALEKSLGAQRPSKPSVAGAGQATGAKHSKPAEPSRASSSSAACGAASSSAGMGGRADSLQQGEQDPIYARLSPDLATGPLAQALKLPEPGDGFRAVGQLLEDLMSTNPRALDARAAIGLKVSEKVLLLDNPVVQAGRKRSSERRLSRQLASKKEQRQLGLYSLAASGLTYDQVLPLHHRWRQYIGTLLASAGAGGRPPGATASAAQQAGSAGPAGTAAEAALLLQADMHGCLLRVAQSNEARWQGLEGVVVRDTQQAFVVVTKESRLVLLPKRRCVFEYELGRGRAVRLGGVTPAPPRTGRMM